MVLIMMMVMAARGLLLLPSLLCMSQSWLSRRVGRLVVVVMLGTLCLCVCVIGRRGRGRWFVSRRASCTWCGQHSPCLIALHDVLHCVFELGGLAALSR